MTKPIPKDQPVKVPPPVNLAAGIADVNITGGASASITDTDHHTLRAETGEMPALGAAGVDKAAVVQAKSAIGNVREIVISEFETEFIKPILAKVYKSDPDKYSKRPGVSVRSEELHGIIVSYMYFDLQQKLVELDRDNPTLSKIDKIKLLGEDKKFLAKMAKDLVDVVFFLRMPFEINHNPRQVVTLKKDVVLKLVTDSLTSCGPPLSKLTEGSYLESTFEVAEGKIKNDEQEP